MALFDPEACTYDNWYNTPLGSFVDRVEKEMIAKWAQPQPGEKALDLGCGTGIFTIWLAKMGLDVTGIDLSSKMLTIAQEKARQEALEIHWIQADIQQIPLDSEMFDLVIGNLVLEFVEAPEKVVAEALRVLKKGGRLVIGLLNKENYWGRTYLQKGKDNPDSVFAHAQFYSEQTISSWEKGHFTSIDYGLYITPENFVNEKQAMELEKHYSRTCDKQQAGFIVATWKKAERDGRLTG